ncbi:energy transducer TonB family protein [Pelagicoccus enzymogenes]|uniref:energy transducer TonB family protein n=1 Tax=Pelagicoccus enzymogenes TaxID=2773457 RepID=UPI002811A4E3|nr:energy transducer TonB [Pelagicoccus enzymogenes]
MRYSAVKRLLGTMGRIAGLFSAVQWAPFLFSQAQVLVSYEDEMLPVVAMSGSTPVVEVQGERMLVPDARVRVENAEAFTDGAIEVLERDAMMGQDYGSPVGGFYFRFVATVRAERDFEDCYVLFVIKPEQGEPSFMLREIPDINTKGTERILITLPANPGFGGGAFAYHIFSRGQEVRRYEPDDPIVVDGMNGGGGNAGLGRSRASASEAGEVEPAEVVKPRLLDFPRSLQGKVGGGYATAIYSIGRNGEVVEFLDFAADHVEFLPEVWKTVVESKYRAGTFKGEPLVTTVRQNFFFNEFAPFSEALEVIPYPDMQDRNATPLYAPLPQVKVASSTVLKLELLVDKLGRVRSSRVVEGENSPAAAESRKAVEKWIFRPAVVGGYPADQTVTVPIAFDIKG